MSVRLQTIPSAVALSSIVWPSLRWRGAPARARWIAALLIAVSFVVLGGRVEAGTITFDTAPLPTLNVTTLVPAFTPGSSDCGFCGGINDARDPIQTFTMPSTINVAEILLQLHGIAAGTELRLELGPYQGAFGDDGGSPYDTLASVVSRTDSVTMAATDAPSGTTVNVQWDLADIILDSGSVYYVQMNIDNATGGGTVPLQSGDTYPSGAFWTIQFGRDGTAAPLDTPLALVAVPEPSTFALVALGQLGLASIAWRRRTRA